MLNSSVSMPHKVARRDTSIKTIKPHRRSLMEVFESGKNGNTDDSSLANEVISSLKKRTTHKDEIDSNLQNYIYEMYLPFIRGHWSNNGVDIPKTKLLRWMKEVLIF